MKVAEVEPPGEEEPRSRGEPVEKAVATACTGAKATGAKISIQVAAVDRRSTEGGGGVADEAATQRRPATTNGRQQAQSANGKAEDRP